MAKWYEKLGRQTGNVLMDVVTLGGHSAANKTADAARDAAQMQSQAAEKGMGMIDERYKQTAAGYQPYQQAGQYGLDALMNFVQSGEAFRQPDVKYTAPEAFKIDPYKAGQFDYRATPGYQYQVDQATKAAQSSAAAKGALQSSATVKKIQENAANLAAQDYGNEFNRFMQSEEQKRNQYNLDRSTGLGQYNQDRAFGYNQYRDAYGDALKSIDARYNSLSNLAGMGMSTQDKLAALGSENTAAIVDLLTQQANAQAAGTMGFAQAKANKASDALNRWNTLANIGAKGAALFSGGAGGGGG